MSTQTHSKKTGATFVASLFVLSLFSALLMAPTAVATHATLSAAVVADNDGHAEAIIGEGQTGVAWTIEITNPAGADDVDTITLLTDDSAGGLDFVSGTATGWTGAVANPGGVHANNERLQFTGSMLLEGTTQSFSVTLAGPSTAGALNEEDIAFTATKAGPPAGSHPPLGFTLNVVVDSVAPAVSSATTTDANKNGLIDGYVVVFNDDIADSTLAAGGTWALAAPYNDNTITVSTGATANDNTILVAFTEETAAVVDTQATPDLTFTPSGTPIQDDDAQLMGALAAGGVAEADGAGPAILGARYLDLTPNGYVDAIRIDVSEDLDDTASQIGASGSPVLGDGGFVLAGSLAGYTISGIETGTAANDRQFILNLNAKTSGAGDTGGAATLSYTPGLVQDAAAALMAAVSGKTVEDRASPYIMSAKTSDGDADGLIDGLDLTLSEAIVDTSISSGWYMEYAAAAKAVTPNTGAAANDNLIRLTFAEKACANCGDTSILPTWGFTQAAGTLKDATGNQAASRAHPQTSTDGAAPIMIFATTKDSAAINGKLDAVVATFSEDITTLTTVASEWTVAGYTITAVAAGTTPELVKLTLTEGTWDTGAKPVISYSGAGTIADAATNDAPAGSKTAIDGAAPIIRSFVPDIGAKTATMRFSEAVSGPGGALVVGDLSFADGAGGAVQTPLNAVTHTAASASATLTFTGANNFILADASGGGEDTIDVVASAVKDAAGLPVATGTVAATLASPAIVGAKTQDANGNGLIDGLLIEFEAAIDDPTFFPPEDWLLTPNGGKQYGMPNGATNIPNFVNSGATADDEFILLNFNEVTAGGVDTAATPSVEYNPASTTGSNVPLKDARGIEVPAKAAFASTDGAKPVVVSATTKDADADGLLDAYTVTFSEPVVDGTFKAADWKIAAATATAIVTGTTANDAIVELQFAEVSTVDTGKLPDVTHTPSTSPLTDAGGNGLAAVASATVAELDKAPPVIKSVTGAVGQNTAVITFSEGVTGSGAAGALSLVDFAYKNQPYDAAQAMTGVQHTAGQPGAVITMTRNWNTNLDLGADQFQTAGSNTLDSALNVAPNTWKTIVSGASADAIAPAAITTLSVVASSATSTTIDLSWTAPGDDGNTGTVSSYEIRHSSAAITASNWASATVASANFGTIVGPGTAQTATVTGLTAGTDYHFAVIAKDEAANEGAVSNSVSATTQSADTTPPAKVDLATANIVAGSTKANSIELTFTAPGDDGATGTVAEYTVKVSKSAIDTDAQFTAATTALATATSTNPIVATYDPATLAAGGANQKVLISGLEQDTEYFVAIKAADEVPNTGAIGTDVKFTTSKDTTKPTGTLAITSSTHADPTKSYASDSPAFSWSGLTDAESTITYYFALNQDEDYTIDGTETGSKTTTSHTFSNFADGVWYFHVNGQSAAGFDNAKQATMKITIETPVLPADDDIKTANEALQTEVKVTRDGEDNVVDWTLPSDLDFDVGGVTLWRANSPFTHLVTLDKDSSAFKASRYIDTGAPADSRYVVTLYFTEGGVSYGFGEDDLDQRPGYTGMTASEFDGIGSKAAAEDDSGMAWWIWVLIAVGVLALIGIIVGIVVASRKNGGAPDTWDGGETDAWGGEGADTWGEGDDTWGDAIEMDETHAEGLVHDLQCPECQTQFTAEGDKPLRTNCPGCGVRGVLN